ncbi:MAG: DUF4810 domain-containing protein [Verrucomicrobiota bacterium]
MKSLAGIGLLLLLSGCSTPTIYYWGHYEPMLYASFTTPGKMPPEREVELMEQDLQKALSANKPMPPGWHAQLGYCYLQLGKGDQAKKEFETEKANFPESKVMMDRLINNLQKP